ncbi:SPFH domain-containing protein [Candidatus Dependentiae bacterium]|nr:SPFH domain-containing protein [Candidatus Dependentiae bacterium]
MARIFDVIEYLDQTGNVMVHRVPEYGSGDFRLGSQLIVRESQEAVFFRDGQALDTFGPGRHTIGTMNIPILTKLISLPFGGETPFKAEVYYVNKKAFTNLKWGTKQPIVFRDTELKMIRLRAFGIFSLRISNSQVFVNKMVGTQGKYTSDAVEDFMKNIIVGRLNDFLGETLKSIFDLPMYYDEIGSGAKSRVKIDFEKYGLELLDFIIDSITPPEEVQKMMDERSGMAAIGDLDAYMKFKTAKAIEKASEQEGGMAGAGIGMGAGMGMGIGMAGMVTQSMVMPGGGGQPGGTAPSAPVTVSVIPCPKCNSSIPANSKFCPSCGTEIVIPTATMKCPGCGKDIPQESKFCPECGIKIQAENIKCPKCSHTSPAGTKFCPSCGTKLE